MVYTSTASKLMVNHIKFEVARGMVAAIDRF